MADTIITNSPDRQGQDSGSAGWVVAVIVLLAFVVGAYVLYQNGAFRAAAPAPAPQADSTNINVTVPTPTPPAPAAEEPAETPAE